MIIESMKQIVLSQANFAYIQRAKSKIGQKMTTDKLTVDISEIKKKNNKKLGLGLLAITGFACASFLLIKNGKFGAKPKEFLESFFVSFGQRFKDPLKNEKNFIEKFDKEYGKITSPIQNDDEYKELARKLMQHPKYSDNWKLDDDNIFATGVIPYSCFSACHMSINDYMMTGKNSFYGKAFMESLVRCLTYDLKKADEQFGQYQGVVFRHGFFGEKGASEFTTDHFYSTSFGTEVLFGNEHEALNVILVDNGHKLDEVRAQVQKISKGKISDVGLRSEKEILLSPDDKYRRIEQPSEDLIKQIREQLRKLPEIKRGGIFGIPEFTFSHEDLFNQLLDKFIFWEKIN